MYCPLRGDVSAFPLDNVAPVTVLPNTPIWSFAEMSGIGTTSKHPRVKACTKVMGTVAPAAAPSDQDPILTCNIFFTLNQSPTPSDENVAPGLASL